MTARRHAATAPPERWQHGAEPEMGATGPQIVAQPVAALQMSGKIGPAEALAAAQYYADYAFALGGAREQKSGPSGRATPDGAMVALVDAMTRYREATAAVGIRGAALLMDLVIEARSCRSIAAERGYSNDQVVVGLAVAVLNRLADHYSAVGVSRRDTNDA